MTDKLTQLGPSHCHSADTRTIRWWLKVMTRHGRAVCLPGRQHERFGLKSRAARSCPRHSRHSNSQAGLQLRGGGRLSHLPPQQFTIQKLKRVNEAGNRRGLTHSHIEIVDANRRTACREATQADSLSHV